MSLALRLAVLEKRLTPAPAFGPDPEAVHLLRAWVGLGPWLDELDAEGRAEYQEYFLAGFAAIQ